MRRIFALLAGAADSGRVVVPRKELNAWCRLTAHTWSQLSATLRRALELELSPWSLNCAVDEDAKIDFIQYLASISVLYSYIVANIAIKTFSILAALVIYY